MPTQSVRSDLLGSDVPAFSLWLLAVVLIAVWMIGHAISRRVLKSRLHKAIGLIVRSVFGTLALWTFWQGVARHLVLETSWSLWTCGMIGTLAIEILIALYQLEKSIVRRSIGRWLLVLRLTATAAVLTILAQPVFSRYESRTVDRNVVVLVDDSGSMQIADKDMPVVEKLKLADFSGIDVMKDRPPVSRLLEMGREHATQMLLAVEALKVADDLSEFGKREFVDTKTNDLKKLEAGARVWSESIRKEMEETRMEQKNLPDDMRRLRDDLRKRFTRDVIDGLNGVRLGLAGKNPLQIVKGLIDTADELTRGIDLAGPYIEAVDGRFYSALPEDARRKIDAVASCTRAALAVEVMTRKSGEKSSFIDQIKDEYTLRLMHFGKTVTESDGAGMTGSVDAEMRSRTDLAGALQKIKESYPTDNLAGVVVLSDFRHNGAHPVDDAARGLGLQGSPVCGIVIGSIRGTKDAAITAMHTPRSIFLGDRVRIKADIKADGFRGRELSITLLKGSHVVHEEKIKVTDDEFTTTLRLGDQPAETGIFSYTVRIDAVEGELFPTNNEWKTDIAVSDDRTNVLLIDDHPRWEFRYLRNLFDSRDKSIHLQHVLLHPDTVEGAKSQPSTPASVSRKFGDSEATALPSDSGEWRKFDVIILGDIPPAVLGEETWRTIRKCVDERGAMLVMIAGPNYMPHAFDNDSAKSLIPVDYDTTSAAVREAPESAFRLKLTAAGRNSVIFVQSDSGWQSARIWDEIPVLRWRHPIRGVKTGAEVLAWASPVPVDSLSRELDKVKEPLFKGDPASALKRQQDMERKNALVITSQVGLGKVVMLTTDQTWRFRYGVGDTYHHKFWGQLMRWGAGENLAAGTNFVRLGTDALNYEPRQKIKIMSRLIDEQYRPLTDVDVSVKIFRGDEQVAQMPMNYQTNSHGMYVAEIDSLTTEGVYRLELAGREVDSLLAKEKDVKVQQNITIAIEGNPVELGETAVNRELANRIASLSGGQVAGMEDVGKLKSLFGAPTKNVVERHETKLWDNWVVLVIAVGAVTGEWILRRRAGVA